MWSTLISRIFNRKVIEHIGRDNLGVVPFSIEVKWENIEKDHDDRGCMSFSINDKEGHCSMRLSLMSKIKKRTTTHHQYKATNHHPFEEEFM